MREAEQVAGAFQGDIAAEFLPADDGLRARVPAPAVGESDARRLAEQSARHRVLMMRGGAVVALTTLASIGGALFLHSVFAGVFVLGMIFHWGPGSRGGGGGQSDEGGAGDGYIELAVNDAGSSAAGPRASEILAGAASPNIAPPAPPALAPLPEATAAQLSAQELSAQTIPPPTPLPTDLGVVRPRPMPSPRQAVEASAVGVSPPGKASGPLNAKAGGPVAGTGGMDDDEPIDWGIGHGSGSGGGAGSGRGKGFGGGLDRGFSAANRPARLLDIDGDMHLTRPIAKSVRVMVTVLASGEIGDIKVVQSCGIADIDQLWVVQVRTTARFSPEIRAGKAVDSVVGPIGYGPDE